MGGVGSGTWWRWDKKQKANDVLCLPIEKMGLQWGRAKSAEFIWSRRKQTIATIGYESNAIDEVNNFVTLKYKRNEESFNYRVGLSFTYPNFGGRRLWFTCPLVRQGRKCHRRTTRLYLPNGARYFGCRQCYGLAYESQSEAPRDRYLRRAWKFQEKIKGDCEWGDTDYTPKPKGMHWKTYHRLHDEMTSSASKGWQRAALDFRMLDGF